MKKGSLPTKAIFADRPLVVKRRSPLRPVRDP